MLYYVIMNRLHFFVIIHSNLSDRRNDCFRLFHDIFRLFFRFTICNLKRKRIISGDPESPYETFDLLLFVYSFCHFFICVKSVFITSSVLLFFVLYGSVIFVSYVLIRFCTSSLNAVNNAASLYLSHQHFYTSKFYIKLRILFTCYCAIRFKIPIPCAICDSI